MSFTRCLRVENIPQAREPIIPERLVLADPRVDLAKRLPLKSIDPLTPRARLGDESGGSKHAEVLRDGGARDAKRVCELVHGLLSLAKQLEQSTARWISEGAERVDGGVSASSCRLFTAS